jgi:hypothetical protein
MTLYNTHSYFSQSGLVKYLLLLLFFCSGCTTIKSVNLEPVKEPYHKIAVMVINTPQELRDFSQASFDTIVKPVFNNLKDIKVRTYLEQSLNQQLSSPGTTVVKISDFFKLHENISYADYLDRMKKNDVEAVLILAVSTHFRPVQQVSQYHTETDDPMVQYSFLYYLVDLNTTQQVWVGVDRADYRIRNVDIEAIGQKLYESHYINKPHSLEPIDYY